MKKEQTWTTGGSYGLPTTKIAKDKETKQGDKK